MRMHFSFSFFSCLAFRHTLISQKIVFPGALPLLYECCPTVGMTGCFGDLLIWQSQTLLLFILNFILALSTVNSLECWLKSCFLLEKAWSCPLVGALLVFPLRLHPLPLLFQPLVRQFPFTLQQHSRGSTNALAFYVSKRTTLLNAKLPKSLSLALVAIRTLQTQQTHRDAGNSHDAGEDANLVMWHYATTTAAGTNTTQSTMVFQTLLCCQRSSS